MPFQNEEKQRVAYLCALTLLFSYAEMLLPRVVPFFRLGLANTVILLALNMRVAPFLLLTVIKAVAASLMAGTLFSPFLLISLAQSSASGIVMYALFYANRQCKGKLLSVYGISAAGSALSAIVQIALSSLYLGSGTQALLGPMLLFNTTSGILTAFLSTSLCIPQKTPLLLQESEKPAADGKDWEAAPRTRASRPHKTIVAALAVLLFAAAVFFIKPIPALCAALFLSLLAQKIIGRRIMFLPHLSLWLFVIISSLLVPGGKVLFSVWNFSITQDALLAGIQKALRLSCVSALSQCAAGLKPSEQSLVGSALGYYRGLSRVFCATSGTVLKKTRAALSATEL